MSFVIGDPRLPQKFWDQIEVDPVTDCWNWMGSKLPAGYGRIYINGKRQYTHRLAYETLVEAIPDGLDIDHLEICLNKSCANPDHMEPVTRGENVRRGGHYSGERRIECVKGHPADENTYFLRGKPMGCLICRRELARKSYHKRRAAA
ncbi:MAG TPA: HNH endonuclease signature motif containing protein [Mycobacterium sp.]|nr:HNH endonuclease signature motif containing protein [Mycobacterium sp.]